MNIILIDAREIADNRVTLTDRRTLHLKKTLRCQAGDTVRVGVINGRTGTGKVIEIRTGLAVLEISVSEPPPPCPPTSLILALPRPIMLKRVLAQATSLGIKKIFLVNASRVEKSFFNASLLEEDKLRDALLLGLEQAMDTILPEVSIHKRFRPFVEDLLPEIIRDIPTRLVAHPDTNTTLGQKLIPEKDSGALLAIGPEGGWVDFEIEQFQKQNFKVFSLGPRILRVDTAVPAILAQFELLRGLVSN